MERGILPSRDGTPLYYEVQGEGPALVFCYGLTCRTSHWRHQVERFSGDYRVVTLDYRGHHRSGMPGNRKNLTLKWCARDVEDVIRGLGIEDAMVFGHSFGVPVAIHLARFVPERVKGLVLVCGSVVRPFEHMFYSNKLNYVFRASSKLYTAAPQLVSRLWHEFTKENWFSTFLTARFGFNAALASEQDVRCYLEGVHAAPFEVFHALLDDYNRFDGRKLLADVTCPALVVAGDSDFVTPFYLQEEMAKLLPKGELVRIEGGSHNAHMDFPGEVNAAIESFLVRVGHLPGPRSGRSDETGDNPENQAKEAT